MQLPGRKTAGGLLGAGPWLMALLSLTLLAGCDNNGPTGAAAPERPWPQTAIVADLSQLPAAMPVASALADLKAVGFDTVLLDARMTPSPILQQWIEAAKTQQLRTVVAVGSPGDFLPARPRADPASDDGIVDADGVLLTLRHPADVEGARDLRARLADKDPSPSLIATVPTTQPAGLQLTDTALPTALFAAVLSDDIREHERLLLDTAAAAPAFPPASMQQATDRTGMPRWQRTLHCASESARCSADVRLLVMGLMHPAVPVTGVFDGPYWRDVYTSLIRLRRENRLILEGDRHWYAADAAGGVLAYRISNDRGQHVIVAINVSDNHHELPLPSGFMAVSKVRIWASYDPTLRERVTSKPVMLPARSAVIVIDN